MIGPLSRMYDQQGEKAADRREGQGRELGDGIHEHVIVIEREATLVRGGESSLARIFRRVIGIHPSRIEADERDHAAPVRPFGGDDLVADRCECPALDEPSGQGRQGRRSEGARRGSRSG